MYKMKSGCIRTLVIRKYWIIKTWIFLLTVNMNNRNLFHCLLLSWPPLLLVFPHSLQLSWGSKTSISQQVTKNAIMLRLSFTSIWELPLHSGGSVEPWRVEESKHWKKETSRSFWARPSTCKYSIAGNVVGSKIKIKKNKIIKQNPIFSFSQVQIIDFRS